MNDAKTLYSPLTPIAGQSLTLGTATGDRHLNIPTNAASADHFTQPATISELYLNERENGMEHRNPFLAHQPVLFAEDFLNDYNTLQDHNSMYNDDDTQNHIDDENQYFDENNDIFTDISDNSFATEQIHCLNRMRQFFQNFPTK